MSVSFALKGRLLFSAYLSDSFLRSNGSFFPYPGGIPQAILYIVWFFLLTYNIHYFINIYIIKPSFPLVIFSTTVINLRATTNRQTMNHIKEILFQRLAKNGVDINFVPGFIRSLVNSCSNDPEMSLSQINRRLSYLGWHGIELDYHTLQLAIACLEDEGLENMENRPTWWLMRTTASCWASSIWVNRQVS